MGIAAYGGEDAGAVGRETRAVGAGVGGEGEEGGVPRGAPEFDGPVPGAGYEGVFCYEVPVDGEDFAFVLGPGRDGEGVEGDVEKLDGSVAASGEELVLVRFRPG